MERLIPAISEMCHPVTWPVIPNATFSQASAAGHTHSGWLVGPTLNPFGRALALASHSALPAKERVQQMSVTYGPLFAGLSRSVDRLWSLASRLQARLPCNGCPEYTLTWKRSAIPCLETQMAIPRLILYRLQASGVRKFGKDFGGWRTPKQSDGEKVSPNSTDSGGALQLSAQAQAAGWRTPTDPGRRGIPQKVHDRSRLTLEYQVAQAAGWPTPQVCQGPNAGTNRGKDHGGDRRRLTAQSVEGIMTGWPTPRTITGGGESAERKKELGREKAGSGDLQAAAEMAGWPTARANDAEKRGEIADDPRNGLVSAANLAGWGTPRVTTNGGIPCPEHTGKGSRLEDQAAMAGWQTPHAPREHDSHNSESTYLGRQVSGTVPSGMSAEMSPGPGEWSRAEYRLNPGFSLWLMLGPSAAFVRLRCVERGMQSYRQSQRSS